MPARGDLIPCAWTKTNRPRGRSRSRVPATKQVRRPASDELLNVHTTPNHTCGLNGIGQTLVVESHNRARVHSPMRIAQVAPLYERVPPELYGGTERRVQ
jgi:hypothetical protein